MKIIITIEIDDDEQMVNRVCEGLDHLRQNHFCEDDWDYEVKTENICHLCGNKCDNLETGVCCFERFRFHDLFSTPKIMCEKCKNTEKNINRKLKNYEKTTST